MKNMQNLILFQKVYKDSLKKFISKFNPKDEADFINFLDSSRNNENFNYDILKTGNSIDEN
jgi:hypothetical protein